ncbi:hypothetical protein DFH27DRAFT_523188 [Peziza echinospora]|nr:hypothetical protein DFH27DRAFT_523188 [Peziza echinospora]
MAQLSTSRNSEAQNILKVEFGLSPSSAMRMPRQSHTPVYPVKPPLPIQPCSKPAATIPHTACCCFIFPCPCPYKVRLTPLPIKAACLRGKTEDRQPTIQAEHNTWAVSRPEEESNFAAPPTSWLAFDSQGTTSCPPHQHISTSIRTQAMMPAPINSQPQKSKRRTNLLGRLFSGSSTSPRDELGLTKTTLRLVPTNPAQPTFAVFQSRMLTRECDPVPLQGPMADTSPVEEEASTRIYYAPVRLPQAPIPRIKITKPDDIPFVLKAEEIWPDWWAKETDKCKNKKSEEEELEVARRIWQSNRSFSYNEGEPEVLDTSARKIFSYIEGAEILDTGRKLIRPQHHQGVSDMLPEDDIVEIRGEWRRLTTPPHSPVGDEFATFGASPVSPVSPVSPTFSEMERISVQRAPVLVRNPSNPKRSHSTSSSVSSTSSASSGPSRKNSLVRTPSVMHSRRRRVPDSSVSRIATDFPSSSSESSLSTSSSAILSSSFPITPPITPPTPTAPPQALHIDSAARPTQDIVSGLYTGNSWTPPSTAGFTPQITQFPPASSASPIANFQKYQYTAYSSPPPRPMVSQEYEAEMYSPVSEISGPIESSGNSAYVVSSRGSVSHIGRRDSLGWESITEVDEPQFPPQTYEAPLEEEDEEEDIEEPKTPYVDDKAQQMARLQRMREMAIEMQLEKERKEREKEMERNARVTGAKGMVIRRKPVFNAHREGVVVIRPAEVGGSSSMA